jgi:hypothetical protein
MRREKLVCLIISSQHNTMDFDSSFIQYKQQAPRSRVLLQKLINSMNSEPFMETEGSLPRSREQATVACHTATDQLTPQI